MLAVIGGLAVASGSSPLAAQTTGPSATRSFDPAAAVVAPEGAVTVTIAVSGYDSPGRITERIPSEFSYVDGSFAGTGASLSAQSDTAAGTLIINLLGASSVSYQVTAPSTEGGPHEFGGVLTQAEDATEYTVSDDSGGVTVSAETGPAPVEVGDLQFDVVPAKAVKGAVVSGLTRPIGTNPLEWEVDTGGAAVTIAGGGAVGEDFRVAETSEGSGKFQLLVEKSGAPALSGTQAISVECHIRS